jgi:uncharacterized protein (DUF302 family)
MKNKIIFALLLGAMFTVTGCNDKRDTAVQSEVKEVVDSAKASKSEVGVKVDVQKEKKELVVGSEDIRVYVADNTGTKITPETIDKAFTDVGFYISADNDMNFPYKRDFNTTGYDVYNLAAFYNKEIIAMFIKEYPQIGLFAPMSMSIYTKKGDKTISIATLSVERMAKITGIPADHPGWAKLDTLLKSALSAALPNGKFVASTNKMIDIKEPLTHDVSFDISGDWEDAKEDFENDFESALTPAGFAMPAFNELSDEIDDIGYDFYEVYSICKIPVIYTVSKDHPEAGAYAPCSLYVYKKEGEDKIHMGYPTVYNWFSSMGFNDGPSKEVLLDAQEKFNSILDKMIKR